jgi:hypothetical protein
MADDVLEETPFRGDFVDDPGDLGPEVAVVILTPPEAREREGLARIAPRDEMNAVAPRSAIEGSEIVPDNSRSQGRVRHPCHESGRCISVSLDITHSPVSGFGKVQTKVEASDSGAKAEAAKVVMSLGGMNSHTVGPFHRGPAAAVSGSKVASDD